MEQNPIEESDELFIEYYENRKSTEPLALKEWIASYPASRETFVSWATEIPTLDFADSLPEDPEQDAKNLAVGLKALKNLGYLQETQPAMQSLIKSAERLGISSRQFAVNLNLDKALLLKLEQRLIQAVTIPQNLISRLAEELKTNVDQVRAYLSQPPTLASSALYRAESAPQVAKQETFGDAVRNSLSLAEEQKTYWTNLPDEKAQE